MIPLLLACSSSNSEPSWKAINGVDVSRFLRIPYMSAPIAATPGQTMTLTFEVVDRERDDIEILIPKAPPGLTVDKGKLGATWDVPQDYWDSFELEVIAMDEHGAFEVVYVPFEIDGGTWQDDTGGLGAGTWLYGLADVSTGFDGELALIEQTEDVDCTWYWPETSLVATVEDCDVCDRAWEVTATGGTTADGDCADVAMATETFPPTRIGFAATYSFRGYELTNVVLTEVEDYGWAPVGEGTLVDDTLEFIAPLESPEE
ncbi:MAG: hypothetical protein GY884_32060 [Proteobacteria bacterium]|nr:hypothetical protein [Pseudomonadota bacterium]